MHWADHAFVLFQGTEFDPETVELLASAYEKACKSLHDRGQPAVVQELIAASIIAAARAGVRDPDLLCGSALTLALGVKAVFEKLSLLVADSA